MKNNKILSCLSGAGGEAGFTIAELIVVVLIIGILAVVVLPQYHKTIESSKSDNAISVVQMIGTTNRMFFLDHQAWVTGAFPASCSSTACCPSDPGCLVGSAATGACILVACHYLAAQDFSQQPYSFWASAPTASCNGYPLGAVACCKRNSLGSPGTPYNNWGYTVDSNGNINYQGGAPPPPSS